LKRSPHSNRSRRRANALNGQTPVDRVWKVLRVLVVDDHPANRLVMRQQLESLGCRVTLAEEGREGLAQWECEPFDAVLTDCSMPVMSGEALATAIREKVRARSAAQEGSLARRAHCLIVGATANAQPEASQRALAAGMDECLIKPIGLEGLAKALGGTVGVTAMPGKPAARPATIDHGQARALRQSAQRVPEIAARHNRDDLLAAHDAFSAERFRRACEPRASGQGCGQAGRRPAARRRVH
ncbi:MAG: response regulator, partial [Pararobbsia sp.]